MGCNNCSGCNGCGGCGGCGAMLELTPGEVDMLKALGQFSFLPVARRVDDMTPVYLEEQDHTKEEYSLILQCLEKKSLISIDYSAPLAGADMSAYADHPVHGSMALTQRGLAVLELMEVQGFVPESK